MLFSLGVIPLSACESDSQYLKQPFRAGVMHVELSEAGDPSASSEAPATCRMGDSYQSSSPAERELRVHPCCT